ncbi:hypothetical protein CRUP_021525, partial [Coryphaenoides rupestris]
MVVNLCCVSSSISSSSSSISSISSSSSSVSSSSSSISSSSSSSSSSIFSSSSSISSSSSSSSQLNSCDQNLSRCCEMMELTASLQGQLCTILNHTASEGGRYAGVDTLKTRLLPWLGTCFSMARPSVRHDTSLQLMQDSALKEKQIRQLSVSHDNNMQKMESQLCSTRLQLDSVKSELAEVQLELDDTKDQSTTTLLATEDEILQLKAELRAALDQLEVYQRKVGVVEEYERQLRLLREEVSYITSEKSLLQESDLYAAGRLEAQALLRRLVHDLATVQRIIFIAVVESFQTAKLAYRQFKLRVRETLSTTHVGPETLEEAAVDYVVRNLDLYDVQTSVNDVINAMNVNPRISFPPEVDFSLVSSLIRETCRLAFAMQTLDPPLDLAFASDGELFNDNKYRRSYDSEFSAPLVLYHVWPTLMEGDAVLVKGEAVTQRGALWRSRSRSSSPVRSRSLSPSRALVSPP